MMYCIYKYKYLSSQVSLLLVSPVQSNFAELVRK